MIKHNTICFRYINCLCAGIFFGLSTRQRYLKVIQMTNQTILILFLSRRFPSRLTAEMSLRIYGN